MTDELIAPQTPEQYLTQTQVRLLNALKENELPLLPQAYEAAVKLIFLMKNPGILGPDFLSGEMATCLISHLSREIINLLMREVAKGRRVDYRKMFLAFITIWRGHGLPIDGQPPTYKTEVSIDDGDIIIPQPVIMLLCEHLQEHHENGEERVNQAKLLLREIYGERFEEKEPLRLMLDWLKEPGFHKYAHLGDAYRDKERNHLEYVMEQFNRLEAMLMEYATDYYDKEGELDEILHQTN